MNIKSDIENQVNQKNQIVDFRDIITTTTKSPNPTKARSNSTNKKSSDSHDEDYGCLMAFGVCTIGVLLLGLIAGAIAYLVFGIMFLVQDYDLAKSCNGSNLWAYVLTAIILAFTRSAAKRDNDNDEQGLVICTLICLGLLEAGLAIWGGVELWVKSCDDLQESNLWTFGLVTFCLQTICASIFLVIIPLVFLFLTLCKK